MFWKERNLRSELLTTGVLCGAGLGKHFQNNSRDFKSQYTTVFFGGVYVRINVKKSASTFVNLV